MGDVPTAAHNAEQRGQMGGKGGNRATARNVIAINSPTVKGAGTLSNVK